jgi:DNA polymerase
VSKATKAERFVGKTSILGCGFGVGGPKFHGMILTQSRLQLGMQMDMDLEQATGIVNAYRKRNHKIAALWRTFNGLIPTMAVRDAQTDIGPLRVGYQSIRLPNGLHLYYHQMIQKRTETGSEWMFTYAGKPKRIYGGKMTENVVQALARIVTMGATLKMKRDFPQYPLAHQVHDELVYVVHQRDAEAVKQALLEHMSTPPAWGRGLPLAAEAGMGESYGEAK